MMPVLKKIYDQMPDPKWGHLNGACASTGGVFDTYTLVQGVDGFIPVDITSPGAHRVLKTSLTLCCRFNGLWNKKASPPKGIVERLLANLTYEDQTQ